MVRFEWNEDKNSRNRQKHVVWFEEAQQVFKDSNLLFFLDKNHSNDEDRYIVIGYSTENLLVVVHTYRENDEIIRIISARKATSKERLFYEKRV